MRAATPEATPDPSPRRVQGCVVVGLGSPELRAITTGVASASTITAEVALGPGDPAGEVDAVRHRLERMVDSAAACVVLALPGEAGPGAGAELDDVARWSATRAFYLVQVLLAPLRRPGRAVVLVTAADGFAADPGPVRSAVESQAVMALTRVLAADVAPGGRACCVAVRGDLLGQADEVCETIRFLCSDEAAHITGQTLVVGRPTVIR